MMNKRIIRIFIGIAVPAVLLAGCWYLCNFVSPLQCLFWSYTGKYCIGCGTGRAVLSILHGQWLKAFSCNPMLFLMGIPAACILAWEYVRFVFLPERMKPIVLPGWMERAVPIILILYWILRNIPMFSFLAP